MLVAIADAANRDGEHSAPGQDAIVEGALYSPGHVRRAIARLVEEGWLEIEDHAAPGRATSYRIPGVAADNAAHYARRSDDDGARTSRAFDADGARPDARPNGNGDGKDVFSPARAAYPPEFEALWRAYPRHTDKAGACKAWLKLTDEDRGWAQAGAERYAADPNLPEEQYRPHLSTWLNRRRWEDGPLPARGARPAARSDNAHRILNDVKGTLL